MASTWMTRCLQALLLLLALLLVPRGGDGAAVFSGYTFKGPGEAEALPSQYIRTHARPMFYRDCRVSGTVDFVFGNGIAVIQRSTLATLPLAPGQTGSVTAQGRKDPNQNTGFSIHNCVVEAKYPTYLGRPWKPFSRVVVMESYLGAGVRARGWLEWAGDAGLATLFYGEYRNFGPGAGVAGRVKWPGYHVIMDPVWASHFTVRRFIDGLTWLPSAGVTFTADLIKK
ncbi:Putative pectinesterase/pectinesterase inhibitor 22 [Triticum urartu]|uniref:Pectinesterase n=1 Tax=Triticum urartu TaxID=4572 RepID=M7ZN98_TRIUA|nr:Putative pectinesterase/pectinesterase inhibitor 22 [Triticum urartu]